MGGKVHDTLNVFSLKEVTYSADVVDVFPYESYRRWYSPDMAPGQIVQDDDVMSLFKQCPYSMTTDIAGTASNKNLQ
jgi:hypothetical protein